MRKARVVIKVPPRDRAPGWCIRKVRIQTRSAELNMQRERVQARLQEYTEAAPVDPSIWRRIWSRTL